MLPLHYQEEERCFVSMSHKEGNRNGMALITITWRWFGINSRFLPAHSGHVVSCAGWKNADGVVLSGSTGVHMCSGLCSHPLAHSSPVSGLLSFVHSFTYSFIDSCGNQVLSRGCSWHLSEVSQAQAIRQ